MDARVSSSKRKRLETAIIENMDAAVRKTMEWGIDDCALWAVEPVRKALGIDPAEKYRGRYKTKIGAHRVLGKGGLASAFRYSARKYGWKRIRPNKAKPGDSGLAIINDVATTVNCRAPGWFVGRSEDGYVALSAEAKLPNGKPVIRSVWRVV